ncbi:MAG: MoaD/ThiS family protein [Promethearchaeia archaeon]
MNKENILVEVKFFANLTRYGPDYAKISVPKDSKVEDILKKYNVPYKKERLIILINSIPHKTPNTILKDGDVIAIFPMLAGG